MEQRIERRPFPRDLEGRLNAVLNVVNTELKVATLLHLGHKPIDGQEIKALVREIVGRGTYLPQSHCFGGYCSFTLFPIGVVAREEITRDTGENWIVGYALTEAGRVFGLPIAAFGLQYAVDHGMSLFNVFGSTASSGSERAPYSRNRILKMLYTGRCSLSELRDGLSCEATLPPVIRSVQSLEKSGFVEYHSRGSMGPINYSWSGAEGEIHPFRNTRHMTLRIADILKDNGEITASKVAKILGHKQDSDSLNILNHLVRQGFASRNSEIDSQGMKESDITLTEEGVYFVENFLFEIDKTLQEEGRALEDMSEKARSLLSDGDRFSYYLKEGIQLYTRISPMINKLGSEEVTSRIKAYVSNNPGSRPTEIEDNLGISRSQNYLTPMVNAGSLRKERSGRIVRYYVQG